MSMPSLSAADILSFQFSSWYPEFSAITIRSTVIRPLPADFVEYLNSDGVHVPEGSDDLPAESTLSDDEEESESDEEDRVRFAFPELDAQIRAVVKEYGSVFPKLNFSSPKDAAWVLPASSPLKCHSPADIYMLLKSSDFITHDITPDSVFEGCSTSPEPGTYALELVLRKWFPVEHSRELRCFVRQNELIGICQRDTNYYEFLNDPATQTTIVSSVVELWGQKIRDEWQGPPDYVFDFLLTRDLKRGHVLDFNPYAPRTDPLLFEYEELRRSEGSEPEFRVVDSRSHPAATRNAPAHQHNMLPFEALSLSNGQSIEEFSGKWKEQIEESISN